eukprot:TRINITY_DN2625_c0_g1_i2.p2 TRINITY_DN2625_c0_g1~~TRINITY_DN2625_c0_g1_i2.p2  ORF type:complete len:291 (-),score=94.72 TRINITY_DN2625_c0_g1_i2:125-997(-)
MCASQSSEVLAIGKEIKGSVAAALFSISDNVASKMPPPKPLHKNGAVKTAAEVKPVEFARQLALMEFAFFTKIRPEECLGLAWSKKECDTKAPNVVACTAFFNKFSGWAANAIVSTENIKERTKLIDRIVKIAVACKEINNFSGMCQMVSALNGRGVHRMKKSWSPESLSVMKEMDELMANNYKSMRELLAQTPPPCLPFLGMLLSDLTFIEEGNQDKLPGSTTLVNWSKMMLTARVLEQIKRCQHAPFNFVPIVSIQQLLENLQPTMTDSEVYQASLKLEPRGEAASAV